jgi:hypothetical protein
MTLGNFSHGIDLVLGNRFTNGAIEMSNSKFYTRSILSIVFGLSLLFTTGLANAARPGSNLSCEPPPDGNLPVANFCNQQLVDLCGAVASAATPPLKQRDKDGLINKVIGAATKINQNKSKLNQLINAPKLKISEADANTISAALMSAQTCVDELP